MKLKKRTTLIIYILALVLIYAFIYIGGHQEKMLTQTEVAMTDDGTTVICYEDDKGNEYIKFGDNPIERVME